MVNAIGRLTEQEEMELREETKQTLELFVTNHTKGEQAINTLAKCPNYFGRIVIAETAARSKIKTDLVPIFKDFLNSRIYTKRATALFFFNEYLRTKPEEMIEIVSNYYDVIKWEAENIIDHFWKNHPELMKKNMMKWIKSDDEKKRSLSFHGLENISAKDPRFIMEFIEHIIDDESLEVQKKITHTIIQIARVRPAEVYPYVKEWLKDADDKRIKTIWVSMKKLANGVRTAKGRDRNNDFVLLTRETIKDWRNDHNRSVHTMGEKLSTILQNSK